MNSPGWQVPNMLLEISGEPTLERTTRRSQSKNNTQQQIYWSSELNSSIPVHLSLLIPKMSLFNLAISCSTTSNFALIHRPNIPCSYALYSIRPCFHHQSHPQLGVVFVLAPSLLSFWSQFSTDLQQHIGYLPTWGVHLSVSYILLFHAVPGVLKAKILKLFAIPFSSGPHFVRTLHHDLSIFGGPT